MTLIELDRYFNSFLKKENYSNDIALNGIQIQNKNPDSKQIQKVAFAVDASEETAKLAASCGADVLFTHHGLFWGGCETITGNHYARIKKFLDNDLALISYHIPLDTNNPNGNNYGLASRIKLSKITPFATWRGMDIGVKGTLKKAMSIEEITDKVLDGQKPMHVLKFGNPLIKTVGICSGGAADDVEEAVKEGLDCFITGEMNHELYHYIKENKINVIAGGHYQTETVGISLVMQKLAKEKKIEVKFIDCPTQM